MTIGPQIVAAVSSFFVMTVAVSCNSEADSRVTMAGDPAASTAVVEADDTTEPESAASRSEPSTFAHFIRREGSTLYDGDKEFRFLSFNVPTLNYVEDEMGFRRTNPYGLPNEYELRDLFQTVNDLGGQVVRSYTIPVRNMDFPPEAITYVEAPGEFNEEAFQAMDLAVALAGEYKVRLVVPLVNNWPWMGGRPNYAAMFGKDGEAFCTDPDIIAAYKQTVEYTINRTNTITGVKYKDDPTIMAWETGNEMTCPGEWITEAARFIKSQAPKQLVVDGFHAVHGPNYATKIQRFSIDEDAIDLISTHHYEEDPIRMIANLKEAVDIVGGEKPIFLGEFGFLSTSGMEEVMDYVISEPRITGGLVWSLRRHHRDGGWYHHTEPLGGGLYRAYHWPGFSDGDPFDERGFFGVMRQKAYDIQGQDVPDLRIPDAPNLLPIGKPGAISWQGSAGASHYAIERASAPGGPWSVIADRVEDTNTPGFALFSDETAPVGEEVYYRVTAHNDAGTSSPSNVVGPVRVNFRTIVDNARSLGRTHRWKDVSVETGDYRSYKEAYSRLSGAKGAELIYTAPGKLADVKIFAFEKGETPMLSFAASTDGDKWVSRTASVESYANQETNYDYLVPREYTIEAGALTGDKYVKIDFAGQSDIVRVEIDYR